MSVDSIYAKLVTAGLSPIGACALMGNMQAESAMRANNAQDDKTPLSDAEYTQRTDDGSYKPFVTDDVGYGLCQWTYAPRKRNLLEFARSRGVSIGDEAMQVEFCLWELRNEYSHLLNYLQTATNLYEAAGRICTEFERPSHNNIAVRAQFANEFYCQFGGCDVSDMENTLPPTPENTGFAMHKDIMWPPRALQRGDKGADVAALQGILLARGYNIGTVDGDFGTKTHNAVAGFQASVFGNGDGIADGKTWAALTAM